MFFLHISLGYLHDNIQKKMLLLKCGFFLIKINNSDNAGIFKMFRPDICNLLKILLFLH